MLDTLFVLVPTDETCVKGHSFTVFTDESSPNWYWLPDFAANGMAWSFSIETEWVQSKMEGSVVAGLVRSAMERRVCGSWACEIGDGEKGLWRLSLWDRRWRKGSAACEIGDGEKGRRLGLLDRWWRGGLWRKKEEMERQWGERHGEWNAERIKNQKVMWTQNKKLIYFFAIMNSAHL